MFNQMNVSFAQTNSGNVSICPVQKAVSPSIPRMVLEGEGIKSQNDVANGTDGHILDNHLNKGTKKDSNAQTETEDSD